MSDHDQAKAFWEEGKPTLEKLKAAGANDYFHGLPNYNDLFVLSDTSVRCIDEGTPGGIHLAGSGILMDEGGVEQSLKTAQVDGMYSHEECGAAKLYAEAHGLDIEAADDYCRQWVEELCKNQGIPYKGHLTLGQMKRPAGLHVAQVIYYDATGQFNNAAAGIPSGFVISRKYLLADYAIKELEVAIGIALGGHGFGELFTQDLPLYIIAVADAEDEADNLAAEFKPLIEQYEGRAVADRLVKS